MIIPQTRLELKPHTTLNADRVGILEVFLCAPGVIDAELQ